MAYMTAAEQLHEAVQAVPQNLCIKRHACPCHAIPDRVQAVREHAHTLLKDTELDSDTSTQHQQLQHARGHAEVQQQLFTAVLGHSTALLRGGHSPAVFAQLGQVLNE